MVKNSGILIINTIKPYDSADTYPVAIQNDIRGGMHQVADITARDAIPPSKRLEGMIVYVISEQTIYRLVDGITNSDWVEGVADHNSLSGKQGGTIGEYYHLTSAQYTAASSLIANLSKSFVITKPTADTSLPLWRVPSNMQVTAIHGICFGGISMDGQLYQFDSNGLNGVAIDSSVLSMTPGTNVNDDGTLSNPNVSAGNYLGWKTTAVSGDVASAIITYEFIGV